MAIIADNYTLKARLYDLLRVKSGKETLDELIDKYRATMEQEDFAFVEKIVNENNK